MTTTTTQGTGTMFTIHITQRFEDGSEVSGWLNDSCDEVAGQDEAGVFDLETVSNILPTLDYDGCKLIDASIEIA